MNNTQHLLVVDDDPIVRELVQRYLANEGYQVSAADSGHTMREILSDTEINIDLVILDLLMPGEDGLSLTRYIHEHYDKPVIILTTKNTTIDRIIGLEVGADDYVTKPFDERELLARVRSVLRRHNRQETTDSTPRNDEKADTKKPNRVQFADWELDMDTCRLSDEHGRSVVLTAGEYELLSVFLSHPRRTLSRDQLLDLTRNRDAGPFDRSIDVQVGRLRRKIEADPSTPTIIITVRGIGYRFVADVIN